MREHGDTVERNVGDAIGFVEPQRTQSSQRGERLSKEKLGFVFSAFFVA